ncbi:MAG: 7-cyano-7-deazaguanine synthase QueC [Hyphomicrobiales bacterium]|nr:7-cyano-7-deazaguanine synthase QueC [Hyphomicrobiales bacterium]
MQLPQTKKAIVLLSGGLDSATTLAIAQSQGFSAFALSFSYGQRHTVELEFAQLQAESRGVVRHMVVPIDLRLFGGSALTDDIAVPKHRSMHEIGQKIPVTYVPARNTIFLSFALAYAESIGSNDILFLGVNALDYSGYLICRPEYIHAFEHLANLATAAGVGGKKMTIHAPLIKLSKADIIKKGLALGVDYARTLSCYDPVEHKACGYCDACQLRLKGFAENQSQDPAEYISLN